MEIVGYYIHGAKEYVAFRENGRNPAIFKITDGFHDRSVNTRNAEKYQGYRKVKKEDINLEKIISRMRGSRPWHPLLDLLRKECIV